MAEKAFQVLYPVTNEDRLNNGGQIPLDVTEGGCWYRAMSAREALQKDIDANFEIKPNRLHFNYATKVFALFFADGEDVHGRVV